MISFLVFCWIFPPRSRRITSCLGAWRRIVEVDEVMSKKRKFKYNTKYNNYGCIYWNLRMMLTVLVISTRRDVIYFRIYAQDGYIDKGVYYGSKYTIQFPH